MNNSITRIILGILLPSFYLILFCSLAIIFKDGSYLLSNPKQLIGVIALLSVIALYSTLIPSIILSILIERANNKNKQHPYRYSTIIGFFIGLIYFSVMSFITIPLHNQPPIAAHLFIALLGAVLGVLTAIPLSYLYKKTSQ